MRFQPVKLLSAVLVCGIAGLALAATSLRAVPAQSTFGFVASQAGAPVHGTFSKYTADIKFDPKDLAGSRFDVTIDLKSTATKDKDRDQTLLGPDFFAADRFPSGHYIAEKFTDQGGGKYTANGKLTLRDVTKDVPVAFTYETKDGATWLKGSAKLARLDFGVGQGEWKATDQVGNDVTVQFSLRLEPSH
jgi:polyisoprenoid-binding protein YceI